MNTFTYLHQIWHTDASWVVQSPIDFQTDQTNILVQMIMLASPHLPEGVFILSVYPTVLLCIPVSGDRIMFILYLPQYVPGPFYFYLPYEPTSEGLWHLTNFQKFQNMNFGTFLISPFEKLTYYAEAMSVLLSVCPSVCPSFLDFFSTCFQISFSNLVYTFSRWHDMSSLSFIIVGSLGLSLQPKVGQTHFLQSWTRKSR